MRRHIFILALLACTLSGCAASTVRRDQVAAASLQLNRVLAESDEASLRSDPIGAIVRGGVASDQFGDYISDSFIAAEKASAEHDLMRLSAIDRSKLGAEEQDSYDSFKWLRAMSLRSLQPDILPAMLLRPVDQMGDFHSRMPQLSSGEGAAPFRSVADYEANLSRLDGFVVYLDRAIMRMREGMAAGVLQPKVVMREVVSQLDTIIGQGVEGSTYYKPILRFPSTISPADRAKLTAAYKAKISNILIPAHQRLRAFILSEYMPKAREAPGLWAMPGGADLYKYLIELQTTTKLHPEEIHQLGLREVARIHAEMEQVKDRVGFEGTLRQFFHHMRSDPKFYPKTETELADGYALIERRVNERILDLFLAAPKKIALAIRPTPAYVARTSSSGEYHEGTLDGSRPGIFYYNSYDLASRPLWKMETMFLHEATPGHHLRNALSQENEALPAFRRFGGSSKSSTAIIEGWGLYAESLGPELGMMKDPYQLFGRLDDEMMRAIRLVIDTGLHAKRWSVEQSIDYMMENSAQARQDVEFEVKRYVADPAQALSYKIGEIRIRQARVKAEKALGRHFDLRSFHQEIVTAGTVPLPVLESRLDRWAAAQRGGRRRGQLPTQ